MQSQTSVRPSLAHLDALLRSYRSVLVAYSGGVDSALVAAVARRALGRDRAAAAIGTSASLADHQIQQARRVARQFDLELIDVATSELDDPDYAANPTNRCYYCKRELWRQLSRVARDRGMSVLADGTIADDLREHRPGRAAALQYGVRSPLAELGFTKADVRGQARELGIPIWDAPAAPCLSSRVQYGLPITLARLSQVEQGERVLRSAGVTGDVRLRHHGDEARIEVAPEQMGVVRERGGEIGRQLLILGFSRVTLDPRGYRRGSLLDPAGPGPVEVLAERS